MDKNNSIINFQDAKERIKQSQKEIEQFEKVQNMNFDELTAEVF